MKKVLVALLSLGLIPCAIVLFMNKRLQGMRLKKN